MSKPGKAWAEWTNREIEILQQIWSSREPIKTSQHLLHRHGLRAILAKGHSMGLPPRHNVRSEYSPAYAVLKAELEKGANYGLALAAKTGVSARRVSDFLMEMHRAKRIHISGWRKTERRGPPFPIYAWGEGDDAPRPKPAAIRNRITTSSLGRCNANPFGQLIAFSKSLDQEAA